MWLVQAAPGYVTSSLQSETPLGGTASFLAGGDRALFSPKHARYWSFSRIKYWFQTVVALSFCFRNKIMSQIWVNAVVGTGALMIWASVCLCGVRETHLARSQPEMSEGLARNVRNFASCDNHNHFLSALRNMDRRTADPWGRMKSTSVSNDNSFVENATMRYRIALIMI
jgi:hypothetical protein